MDPRQADPEQFDRDDDPQYYDEPPDEPRAVNQFGTTEAEAHRGESLDDKLAEEMPDRPAVADDAVRLRQPSDPEQDTVSEEVASEARSDRLSAEEQAVHAD